MTGRIDLLILGGGPAGSALALLAARAGLRVRLVERDAFPRDKVCGEFVSAEGQAALDRLGARAPLLDAGARAVGTLRVTDLRGRALDAELPEIAAGRDALGVSRARMDEVLLDLARAAGVEVRERCAAVAPLLDSERVVGCVVREVGTERAAELRAPLVVAADGRRSMLGRHLHDRLGDPRRTRPASWFGHKVHLAGGAARDFSRVELHLFDGGYAGLSPVEGERINLCFLARAGALRQAGGSPARLLEGAIAANPAARESIGAAVPCAPWKSIGPLRFGRRRAAAAGALFVGDAAGTIEPFSGEGISNALLAAELAAPIAEAAVAAGGLTVELARAYQVGWDARFGRVTRRARLLAALFARPRLAGPLLAALRGPAAPFAARLVAATRTGAHG